jgi:hypothetical protein
MPEVITAFEIGFNAYCRRAPFDISQSQEWQNGWTHAQAVEDEILSTG